MQLIKLDATDSTNAYLKALMASQEIEDYCTVVARNQRKGRGQMGAHWLSKPGKNLTFSVLRKGGIFWGDNPFILNVLVSLAIFNTLKESNVPDLSIKWPNDILSGISKICGILIENVLSGNTLKASIIGIGLNVNQTHFPNLSNVSSLKLVLGREQDLEGLLDRILKNIRQVFQRTGQTKSVWESYENVLFGKGVVTEFQNRQGLGFKGTILGVSQVGKLIVLLEEGGCTAEYDFKEIRFILPPLS
ncbi:MAG: biotin--[acetyl-CoA-carboxylase] ligase [Bacteroidota bacterium]